MKNKPSVCTECKQPLGDSTDDEICCDCCDHDDVDDFYCLVCGYNTFEDEASDAYDRYKDRDRD